MGPFYPEEVGEVLVGHYGQGPAELERRFVDLESVASELYRASVASGTSVDLFSLTDASGRPFPGISGTGTWLVALRSYVVRIPAPWYLSVLSPCQS